MAEYTQNYNLKKPAEEDFYNINDHNDNMDIIDTALKAHDDALATKETPEGAQEKADAALNSAKQYTDQEVGEVTQELAAHKADTAAHITTAERTKWNNTLAGFSSLESIGLTDEDFTGLSASDAFTLLLTKMYAAGLTASPTGWGNFPVLKIYIVKDGGGNYPILSTIVRTKLNADVGVSASTTEGVLIIDGGLATTAQNKITFYCNATSGNDTVEYVTFFDNTLGTFKPVRTANSIADALTLSTDAPSSTLGAGKLWGVY